jgi:hypothetical protein
MLRRGSFKYVRPLNGDDLEELYDLSRDPEELENLAVQAEHQQTLRTFRAAAIEALRRNGAGFVDSMPPVREASEGTNTDRRREVPERTRGIGCVGFLLWVC